MWQRQARAADLSATAQETLSAPGIILARTMGRGPHLTRRFARLSDDLAQLDARAQTAGEPI